MVTETAIRERIEKLSDLYDRMSYDAEAQKRIHVQYETLRWVLGESPDPVTGPGQ